MSLPHRREFKPLNGQLAIELVDQGEQYASGIWRIIAIADNANLEHYKLLKVGDLIACSIYSRQVALGTITYIKPGSILAIYPAA